LPAALSAEGFRWVAQQFGEAVLLNVGSGGTDVCTGLVQGSPLLPIWVGEMSGPSLGVDIKAFDEHGRVVVGELGELVITSPMPSMPVGFWGDADDGRLRESYFSEYPGVFRFGDWCRFTAAGTCLITGRSDATLNRGGVRIGTGEFYRALQDMPGVADSVWCTWKTAPVDLVSSSFSSSLTGLHGRRGPAPQTCVRDSRGAVAPTRSRTASSPYRRSRTHARARSWRCRSRKSSAAPTLMWWRRPAP
jgi:hypothetical protein